MRCKCQFNQTIWSAEKAKQSPKNTFTPLGVTLLSRPGTVVDFIAHVNFDRTCLNALVLCQQANVSTGQGSRHRLGPASEIFLLDGHRPSRWLPIQVPQLSLDGGRKGRSWNAKTTLHASGFTEHRGAVDAENHFISQNETHQQHRR